MILEEYYEKIFEKVGGGSFLIWLCLSLGTAVGLSACKTESNKPIVIEPTPTPTPAPEINMEKVNDLLGKLESSSYTVSSTNTNNETSIYKIEKQNLYQVTPNGDKYLNTVEDGKNYSYVYGEDNIWYRNDSETEVDVDEIIYNDLKTLEWKTYDSKNTYTAVVKGKENIGTWTVVITPDNVSISRNQDTVKISNFGTTVVEIPDQFFDKTQNKFIDKTQNEIPMEPVNKLLDDLATQSFTLEQSVNGLYNKFEIVGDSYHVYEADDNIGTIYEKQDDDFYVYTYNLQEDKWHKNETETFNVKAEQFLDLILNGNWIGYDENTEIYYLNPVSSQAIYAVSFKDDYVSIKGKEGEAKVSEIGTTTLNMPDPSKIVDETIETPQDPAEETDLIYTIDENGNYEFNVVLLKEVMENWMKGDNQFGKDVLAEKYGDTTLVSDKIYYINASTEKIEMGLLYHNADYYAFGTFKLQDTVLFEDLKNEKYQTKDDFVKYLNSIKKTKYSCPDGIKLDLTISEENFATMTTNVFNKLVTTGYQGSNINNPGTIVEDLKDAEVLYGFKTVSSNETAGAGLGYKRQWHQMYLISINGKVELVDMYIISSTMAVKDELENVINNKNGQWLVSRLERTQINDNNKDLYNNAE